MHDDVPILAYHKISNKFEWGINNVSLSSFQKQMNYLFVQNYYTLSIEDFLKNNYKKRTKQRPVIITFDDGDESVYLKAFPILKKFGFLANVFIVSKFVGKKNSWDANLFRSFSKHLSWKQINKLSSAGWCIGSHTATHQDLTILNQDQIYDELTSSKNEISKQINREINYISYPFNKYNIPVIEIAQKIGYRAGFILSTPKFTFHKKSDLAFTIPRYGVYRIDTNRSFQNKLSLSKFEADKQRFISFFSSGTIWYNRLKI